MNGAETYRMLREAGIPWWRAAGAGISRWWDGVLQKLRYFPAPQNPPTPQGSPTPLERIVRLRSTCPCGTIRLDRQDGIFWILGPESCESCMLMARRELGADRKKA